MNSRTIVLAALLALNCAAVLANECAPEIAKVDANLNSAAPVTTAELAKAQDLRDRAVVLCATGDVNGGLALLAEAKTILKIQ